jgi:hypothetical protein
MYKDPVPPGEPSSLTLSRRDFLKGVGKGLLTYSVIGTLGGSPGKAVESAPVPSGLMAFYSDRTGHPWPVESEVPPPGRIPDIYVLDLGDRSLRQLNGDRIPWPGSSSPPNPVGRWSPDGSRLAWGRLWISDREGGIQEFPGRADFAWGPGSDQLALVTQSGLMIMGLDGTVLDSWKGPPHRRRQHIVPGTESLLANSPPHRTSTGPISKVGRCFISTAARL